MLSSPNVCYRISPANRSSLRIGLLLDSRDQTSAFVARIIEDIKASNFASIELLIVRQTGGESPRTGELRNSSALKTLRRRISDPQLRKQLLYDLYLRVDS